MISKSVRKKIYTLHTSGFSRAEIAVTMGCSPKVVRNVLNPMGISFPVSRHGDTPERTRAIISLRKEGCTLHQIADMVGVGQTTVHRVLALSGQFPIRARGDGNVNRNRQILSMRKQGHTIEAIAKSVGASLATVHGVLAQSKRFSPSIHRVPDDDIREMLTLHAAGQSLRTIGAALGHSYGMVASVLRRVIHKRSRN